MIEFSEKEQALIKSYDGVDYNFWNSGAEELKTLRKKYREYNLGRQGYKCCYCQQTKLEGHGWTWDVEHIAPKSVHPSFLFESYNIAVSCKECNIAKSESNTLKGTPRSYPKNGANFLIIHPHFDNYDDHIEIVRHGNQITYRAKNGGKGKETYMMCNLIRFDYAYAGWNDFGSALVGEIMKCFDELDPAVDYNTLRAVLPVLVKSACR